MWVCGSVCGSVCLDFTKLLHILLFLLHLSYCSPMEFICKIFCVMTWIFLTWEWIPTPRYALIGRIGGNPGRHRSSARSDWSDRHHPLPHARFSLVGSPSPLAPRSLLIGRNSPPASSGRSRQINGESQHYIVEFHFSHSKPYILYLFGILMD